MREKEKSMQYEGWFQQPSILHSHVSNISTLMWNFDLKKKDEVFYSTGILVFNDCAWNKML